MNYYSSYRHTQTGNISLTTGRYFLNHDKTVLLIISVYK